MIVNRIVAKFDKFDKFSAFMIWSMEERKRLQKENPTVRNAKISQILGEMWKQVSDETKK